MNFNHAVTPWEEVQDWIHASNHPWRVREVLVETYFIRHMSLSETADVLGCSAKTVLKWMERHGFPRRDKIEELRRVNSVNRASYSQTNDGHQIWKSYHDGETTTVGVHVLTAIADGADPYEVFSDGTHIHHKNGVPWDNRGDNLEVLTISKHRRTHSQDEWIENDGWEELKTKK